MKIENIFDIETNFHRKNTVHPLLIVIVGCGGTGSRIAPLVAQHIANHNKALSMNLPNMKIKTPMELLLIDGDGSEYVLEEKNLRRQGFYKFDVGLPKAEALSRRLSALYGIKVNFKNQLFNAQHSLRDIAFNNLVIFDCTDNILARREIEKRLLGYYYWISTLLITCGNEDTYGQIHLSYSNGGRDGNLISIQNLAKIFYVIENKPKDINGHYISERINLPTFLQCNPNFKDSAALSCDQRILADDQSMPVNNLVATVAFNAFYTIMATDKFNYYRCNVNINNQFHTYYNSESNILKLIANSVLSGDNESNLVDIFKEIVDKFVKGNNASYTSWQRSSFSSFLSSELRDAKYANIRINMSFL